MKTQMFGISSGVDPLYNVSNGIVVSSDYQRFLLCSQTHAKLLGKLHPLAGGVGFKELEALNPIHPDCPSPVIQGNVDITSFENYKKARGNGTDDDSPNREFPHDGVYTWETPGTTEGIRLRYTGRAGDEAWMKERDRNYLARLFLMGANTEQEKQDLTENRERAEKAAQEVECLKPEQLSPWLRNYFSPAARLTREQKAIETGNVDQLYEQLSKHLKSQNTTQLVFLRTGENIRPEGRIIITIERMGVREITVFTQAWKKGIALTHICFWGLELGLEGTQVLAGILQHDSKLKDLHFTFCGIGGEEGVVALAEALKSNDTLEILNFGGCGIAETGTGGNALAEMLHVNSRLQTVIIDSTSITPSTKLQLERPILGLKPLQDGRVVIGEYGGTIRIYNEQTRKTEIIPNSDGYSEGLAILPDRRLAAGCDGNRMKIWDAHLKERPCILPQHTRIRALIALDDGKLVAGYDEQPSAGSENVGEIRVWLPQTDGSFSPERYKVLQGHTSHVMAFTVVNNYLISGSCDGRLIIWDLGNYERVNIIEHAHKSWVLSLVALPNGQVASAGRDDPPDEHFIRIWDKCWEKGSRNCVREFPGHKGDTKGVTVLGLMEDTWLVSADGTGVIKVWDITDGKCCWSIQGQPSPRVMTVLSNQRAIIGSQDGRVAFWSFPLRTVMRQKLVELREARAKIRTLEDTAKIEEKRVAQLEQELKTSDEAKQVLERTLSEKEVKLRDLEDMLRVEKERAATENARLSAVVTARETEYHGLVETKGKLEETLHMTEEKTRTLEERVKVTGGELVAMKQKVEELTDVAKQKDMELQRIQAGKADVLSRLENAQKEIEELREEARRLTAERQSVREGQAGAASSSSDEIEQLANDSIQGAIDGLPEKHGVEMLVGVCHGATMSEGKRQKLHGVLCERIRSHHISFEEGDGGTRARAVLIRNLSEVLKGYMEDDKRANHVHFVLKESEIADRTKNVGLREALNGVLDSRPRMTSSFFGRPSTPPPPAPNTQSPAP